MLYAAFKQNRVGFCFSVSEHCSHEQGFFFYKRYREFPSHPGDGNEIRLKYNKERELPHSLCLVLSTLEQISVHPEAAKSTVYS